jgi:hypothetical protein
MGNRLPTTTFKPTYSFPVKFVNEVAVDADKICDEECIIDVKNERNSNNAIVRYK